MQQINVAELDCVEAILNYLEYSGERPAYYLYEPTPGLTPERPPADRRSTQFYDIRSVMDRLTLDRNGVAVVKHSTPFRDFLDADRVRSDYYPEVAALVKAHTGAARVNVFDHNVRSKPLSQQAGSGVREPVRFAHNDYTEKSGPQRVRDLFEPAEAERLLQHRYVFINAWRPIRGPVLDFPLAVCNAESIEPSDFVATDLKYADRTGEIYSVRYNAAHQWMYISHMQPDEVMLLKCFDSARDGRARYTAHSAFKHPDAPPDAPSRESIEARTIVFFDATP